MKDAFKIVAKEPVFIATGLPNETLETLIQDYYETHDHLKGLVEELIHSVKQFGVESVISEANKIKEQQDKAELENIRRTLRGFAEALERN